jgi:RNA polymerase sigma-70 factor (ECF subfamily)
MSNHEDSRTSLSLLELLRRDPSNPAAWDELVRRYRPKVYEWCCTWGLQESDADDVVQTVLVKLTESLRDFEYDPAGSFRAWLRTVTNHALSDFAARRQREAGIGGDRATLILETAEAGADLERQLAEAFDHELLAVAMLRVQQRVAALTWEAFRLTALEGLSGADASRRLHMTVTNVFVAKHRVQKMIQEELHWMKGSELA